MQDNKQIRLEPSNFNKIILTSKKIPNPSKLQKPKKYLKLSDPNWLQKIAVIRPESQNHRKARKLAFSDDVNRRQ